MSIENIGMYTIVEIIVEIICFFSDIEKILQLLTHFRIQYLQKMNVCEVISFSLSLILKIQSHI